MILFSVVFALAGQAATVGTVIPIIGEPKGMAYDAARKLLFISNSTQNRVEVFSTEQMQLLTPITVGVKPGALELVPDSTLLLVCNTESTSLSVIDREALAATGTIPVTARSVQTPERPFSVAALSNGTALLSTNVGLQRIDLVARTTQPITNAGFAVPANVNLVSSGNHKFVLGQGGTVAFLYTDQGFAQVRAAAGSRLLAADAGGTRFLVG
ncbi:MAG TPA: hypothetical protein VNN17_11085, partial [Terriglobia bacterium]|nr:hypothetical protein [Terriglobia bacterium]